MITAVRAEDVLCADETPVNVVDNIEPDGQPAHGAPHVVTVRTPDPRLVWYKQITARSSARIAAMGVFDNWRGILVRDDYTGWHQFDPTLAAVGQRGTHLIRHLRVCSTSTPTPRRGQNRSSRHYATSQAGRQGPTVDDRVLMRCSSDEDTYLSRGSG